MAGDRRGENQEITSQQVVTKALLDDAVDTILEGMDNLYFRFKGELDGFRKEMSSRFDGVDHRFDKVATDVSFLKREAEDRKADLADTPSRKEFNELRTKVDHYQSKS
jgi:hypothetical protein